MLISQVIMQLRDIYDSEGDLYVMAARDAEGNGFRYVRQVSWDGYDTSCDEVFEWTDDESELFDPAGYARKVVIIDVV